MYRRLESTSRDLESSVSQPLEIIQQVDFYWQQWEQK